MESPKKARCQQEAFAPRRVASCARATRSRRNSSCSRPCALLLPCSQCSLCYGLSSIFIPIRLPSTPAHNTPARRGLRNRRRSRTRSHPVVCLDSAHSHADPFSAFDTALGTRHSTRLLDQSVPEYLVIAYRANKSLRARIQIRTSCRSQYVDTEEIDGCRGTLVGLEKRFPRHRLLTLRCRFNAVGQGTCTDAPLLVSAKTNLLIAGTASQQTYSASSCERRERARPFAKHLIDALRIAETARTSRRMMLPCTWFHGRFCLPGAETPSGVGSRLLFVNDLRPVVRSSHDSMDERQSASPNINTADSST